MKTEINIEQLVQSLGLVYPEILQISDDSDGYIRLIGYVTDLPVSRENKWFYTTELITINPVTNKVMTIEPTKVKNQDWVITNNYYAIVASNHKPVVNPDFKKTKEIIVDYDEQNNPIYETVAAEITLENSPYKLSPAFDYYFGLRHSKTKKISVNDFFTAAVESHDRWGYFDKKENHIELIDVIKCIYENQS